MRKMFTDEFRCLEVINLCGGERLGFPSELEIDLECGNIIAFTVVREGRGFSFFCEREEYVIPWCKIECIGEDAILVDVPQGIEDCACQTQSKRKWWSWM